MATPGNNNPGTPVITGDAVNVENAVDAKARQNVELFKNIAVLESPIMLKDGGTNRAIIDKAMKDRVVDMGVAGIMKSVKLNLTSNGALLLSLNDGKQLFNHPVSMNEREALNKIVNNPNMTDDMKQERLTMLMNGISMNVKLSNNFEQSYQQAQSMSTSYHR